ncbi:Aste57867_1511 [Aphanomyces stellatus]|uniref:Aste57867_1511 protein n=1 Tax=Aphanomyces stellatus TaxID=120398 RepID=A0A485K9K8_9STRA|nr:hypothetical protein As57867_001510 [Aphanomyces stellatus]VFT78727.1 Aste57867_1511 [Aphanomyces stellatus]
MVKVFGTLAPLVASAAAFGSLTDFPVGIVDLMDPTANPCADFYQYACGAWIKRNDIPPTKGSLFYAVDTVQDNVNQILDTILAANKPQLSEFYASCLDTSARNDVGINPLNDLLEAIRCADTNEAVLRAAAQTYPKGGQVFGNFVPVTNPFNSTLAALGAMPYVLTLPSAKNYADPKQWAAVEPAYRVYISSLLTLAGMSDDDAKAAQDKIINFERAMLQLPPLQTNSPRESVLDTRAGPPVMTELTFFEANQKFPLSIGLLLEASGVDVTDATLTGHDHSVLFQNLDIVKKIEDTLNATAVATLQLVAEFHLLHSFSASLTDEFATARWLLFDKQLKGATDQPSQEEACRAGVDAIVGDVLGAFFLEETWTDDVSTQAEALVSALSVAYKTGLDKSDWLDAATRQNAQTKLVKMVHTLGGPPTGQLYADTKFDPTNYVANIFKVNQVNVETGLTNAGEPVGRDAWNAMTHAQTVNAYYNRMGNSFAVTAAIMQAPFFTADVDPAQNFGAIGMVMSHEITHGFDTNGRYFDGEGKQVDWWSKNMTAAFMTKTKCIEDQYNGMDAVSDITGIVLGKVNGTLTLGENIADNGGVKNAFRAYKEYMKTAESDLTEATGEKTFFVAYAQAYCEKRTDAALKQLILTNVHAPGRSRANGPLQNNAEFARVFNCPAKSAMNPETKCTLWE